MPWQHWTISNGYKVGGLCASKVKPQLLKLTCSWLVLSHPLKFCYWSSSFRDDLRMVQPDMGRIISVLIALGPVQLCVRPLQNDLISIPYYPNWIQLPDVCYEVLSIPIQYSDRFCGHLILRGKDSQEKMKCDYCFKQFFFAMVHFETCF